MASFRADLVDGMLANAGISALVSTRIYPIIFTFEDMLNTAANAKSNFPRITVETLSQEEEDNVNTHDNLYFASYQISLFHEVHVKSLRSRVESKRTAERNKIRTSLDGLFDAVESYLKPLRQTVVGSHLVRRSHISNVSEEEFQIDRNRIILSDRIIYNCSFSKT